MREKRPNRGFGLLSHFTGGLPKSNFPHPGLSNLEERKMFHFPVMAKEVFSILVSEANQKEGVIVDGTVGAGGHLSYLVKNSPPTISFLGIDIDPDAVGYCQDLFKSYKNVTIRAGNYAALSEVVEELGLHPVIGVLIDCGVGRFQLDALNRGFSFRREAPLDMRFSQAGKTARDLIRRATLRELERILSEYGEVRHCRKIARAIVGNRDKIETTFDLNRVVVAATKGKGRKTLPLVYMSLRRAVNQELENIEKGIEASLSLLAKGGRIVVISYDSLEDRIAKTLLRKNWKEGKVRILTAKPLVSSPKEVRENPSSRSAKLRAAEKL